MNTEQRDNNVPNLDEMPISDLLDFWFLHQSGRAYKTLFPFGGKETKRAAADLANYAGNKFTAMSSRLRGDISTALVYERIADRIYSELPVFAKWKGNS